jgi:hypothetical protein
MASESYMVKYFMPAFNKPSQTGAFEARRQRNLMLSPHYIMQLQMRM